MLEANNNRVCECEQTELTNAFDSLDFQIKESLSKERSQLLDSGLLGFKQLLHMPESISEDQESSGSLFSDINDIKQFPYKIQETLKRYVSQKNSKKSGTLQAEIEKESLVQKYVNMSTKQENLLDYADLDDAHHQISQSSTVSRYQQYLGTLGQISIQQLINTNQNYL